MKTFLKYKDIANGECLVSFIVKFFELNTNLD